MSPQHPQPTILMNIAAPEDIQLLVQWETHLLPLQQAERITFWSAWHILPGEIRGEQINRHFAQADILVLLLSANFFASDECNALMERAMQQARSGRARVVPLLLRFVAWNETILAGLTCLPTDERPVTGWANRDEAFHNCVEGIKKLLNSVDIPSQPDQQQAAPTPQTGSSSAPLYHSCFISYAHEDEQLARRLHTDLQSQGVQCWFAPHNMKIGARIRQTIDQAISQQDKLLLLLSQSSINSSWVEDEVEAALEKERLQQKPGGMLFPIRLDESVMKTNQAWAASLRRLRHIGNFCQWQDEAAYQQALQRLLRDLKDDE